MEGGAAARKTRFCTAMLPAAQEIRKRQTEFLVALTPLKWALRSGRRRWTTPVVSGYRYRRQRNVVAASGAVILIPLQCHNGYARLEAALGTRYESFTSGHAGLSFLSQAGPRPEKALLPKHIQGFGMKYPPQCLKD